MFRQLSQENQLIERTLILKKDEGLNKAYLQQLILLDVLSRLDDHDGNALVPLLKVPFLTKEAPTLGLNPNKIRLSFSREGQFRGFQISHLSGDILLLTEEDRQLKIVTSDAKLSQCIMEKYEQHLLHPMTIETHASQAREAAISKGKESQLSEENLRYEAVHAERNARKPVEEYVSQVQKIDAQIRLFQEGRTPPASASLVVVATELSRQTMAHHAESKKISTYTSFDMTKKTHINLSCPINSAITVCLPVLQQAIAEKSECSLSELLNTQIQRLDKIQRNKGISLGHKVHWHFFGARVETKLTTLRQIKAVSDTHTEKNLDEAIVAAKITNIQKETLVAGLSSKIKCSFNEHRQRQAIQVGLGANRPRV